MYHCSRQLAFMRPDSLDGYLRMLERTTRECIYKFARVVIILYRERYLCKPKISNIHQLYTTHENKYGFSRMFGSIDCMHWGWSIYVRWSKNGKNNFRRSGFTWSLGMTCIFWSNRVQQRYQHSRPITDFQRHLPWEIVWCVVLGKWDIVQA